MAASNMRARRLTDNCEHRQRKSVRKLIQKSKGREKKEEIHKEIHDIDGIAGGIDGRATEGAGERTAEGIGRRIGGKLEEGTGGVVGEGADRKSDAGIDGRMEERLNGGRGDGKMSPVKEGEPEETSDKVIRCFCTREVESGKMVCCEVCEGWLHIRCLGMKEDAGVMEGKAFVCYFCLSVCLVQMRREVVVSDEGEKQATCLQS